MEPCRCFAPPFDYRDFVSESIGVDPAGGRYGEVWVLTCKRCATRWLHYHLENEAFSRSGRWFRGLLTDGARSTLTPENAAAYLRSLPWHFAGGSYYDSPGFRLEGPAALDL